MATRRAGSASMYMPHLSERGEGGGGGGVEAGTKEFKIAGNKRDLFLGFSEHQERQRKKLALEEGRIFAANEQLSSSSASFLRSRSCCSENPKNKSLLLLAILNSLVPECTTFKLLLVPLFENEEDLHRT
ncbi:hypothetical protein GmHk_09G025292 [Glycine max]|nr:hypothetical protein GmHk_09G025292 [Glycine max]